MMGSDVKVVLLGKENSGKTSLLYRFINDRFLSTDNQSTLGAGYASCKVVIEGKPVMVGIWDTAGSERFEAMSRFYYRNARAAVVCFNLVDYTSFARAKYWVQDLLTYEQNCKLYLCGTKKDLIAGDDHVIDPEEVKSFYEDIGAIYFETSSKTGENVESLFHSVAQHFATEGYHHVLNDSIGLSTTVVSKRPCCIE